MYVCMCRLEICLHARTPWNVCKRPRWGFRPGSGSMWRRAYCLIVCGGISLNFFFFLPLALCFLFSLVLRLLLLFSPPPAFFCLSRSPIRYLLLFLFFFSSLFVPLFPFFCLFLSLLPLFRCIFPLFSPFVNCVVTSAAAAALLPFFFVLSFVFSFLVLLFSLVVFRFGRRLPSNTTVVHVMGAIRVCCEEDECSSVTVRRGLRLVYTPFSCLVV